MAKPFYIVLNVSHVIFWFMENQQWRQRVSNIGGDDLPLPFSPPLLSLPFPSPPKSDLTPFPSLPNSPLRSRTP